MESSGAYVTNEFHAANFAWSCVESDRPPVLMRLSPGEGWMPLHDAVAINCKRAQLLNTKAQVF